MWKIHKDENNKRTYINSQTGSQCIQSMVYTDKDGNNWFSFDDLLSIPYTRQFAATKISSLYSLGLSREDLTGFIGTMKGVLKSADPEKYEKAFASLLDFENKANNATDAIKQLSSLTCVYFTINDEPIDSFDNNLQIKKMAILEADIEAHSFFLQLQIKHTEDYTRRLGLISAIVSPTTNGL